MRMLMESQRKSMISREIGELTLKYEANIESLMSELKRSRSEISSRYEENERLKMEVVRYEAQYEEYLNIEEGQQDKIVMLSQENYRLNELLRSKNEEAERAKAV